MCAIFSWLVPAMDRSRFEFARKAVEAVTHRGPDGGGYAWWPANGGSAVFIREGAARNEADEARINGAGLLLGHRRLSILDLSDAGAQPMQYGDRYSIVFNGEIYNYVELREELKQQGCEFHTHCDTEVILAAYATWGQTCLQRFNGMFAFVLYDAARHTFFAARDRFGVKPLYYWITPDGSVAFASEIKQFQALPGWKAKANGPRLYDYIAWGVQDHTAETMYAGVYQFQPGEMLTLTTWEKPKLNAAGRLPTEKWYRIPDAPRTKSYEDAAAEIRELLRDSVKLRLRADVPVGSCLSGGLDSSAIVCLLNGIRQEQKIAAEQMTFSARSNVAAYDEGKYMLAVAEAVKSRHNETVLNPGVVFDSLPEILRWQDEPFGSASIYAQHLVFKMAAENGIKVMLDGQGADEIFAGYGSFKLVHLASLAAGFHLLKLAKAFADSRNSIPGGFGYSSLVLLVGLADRYQLRKFKPPLGEQVLNMERLGAKSGTPFLLNGRTPKSLRDFSLINLTANLPMLLHWEDRNSMAHSVEARLPFLDYRVVEFALNVPDDFKIRDGRTKAVLRQGVDPLVPPLVAQRKDKLGFSTGEFDWQRGALKQTYIDRMREAKKACRELFNDKFEMLIAAFEKNPVGEAYLPWRVICAHQWISAQNVSL
jgi:asparagine synthase (glutamine-hydrolysing)